MVFRLNHDIVVGPITRARPRLAAHERTDDRALGQLDLADLASDHARSCAHRHGRSPRVPRRRAPQAVRRDHVAAAHVFEQRRQRRVLGEIAMSIWPPCISHRSSCD